MFRFFSPNSRWQSSKSQLCVFLPKAVANIKSVSRVKIINKRKVWTWCQTWWLIYALNPTFFLRCNEDKLKKLVYKYGAVATGIYASDRGLSNVNKGVFDQCSTTKINHAVTVVGYGTQNGRPYWLIKNSWGDNWGDGGYVRIGK